MTRFYYIISLTVAGFFLTPSETYACSKKSDPIEQSCSKDIDSKSEKKHCCNKEGSANSDDDGCNGKCGNPACHCPTNFTSFTVPFFAQLSQVKVMLSKSNYYYQEAYYSSGFLSIWLPPKIG